MAEERRIPFIRKGRTLLFDRIALDKWMQTSAVSPPFTLARLDQPNSRLDKLRLFLYLYKYEISCKETWEAEVGNSYETGNTFYPGRRLGAVEGAGGHGAYDHE
jgi:hypothetical protein